MGGFFLGLILIPSLCLWYSEVLQQCMCMCVFRIFSLGIPWVLEAEVTIFYQFQKCLTHVFSNIALCLPLLSLLEILVRDVLNFLILSSVTLNLCHIPQQLSLCAAFYVRSSNLCLLLPNSLFRCSLLCC